MMKPMRSITLVAVGLAAAALNADTIYVCWDGSGDYLTIQQGIDAAADGDEVVVCDGVYVGPGNKDLEFHARAITVRSANGPVDCVIDCQASGRGFDFVSGETPTFVVRGFTIINGSSGGGGAIRCRHSNPTIENCIITGNTTSGYGGGIYCFSSSPTIANCTITANMANGYGGGGISCWLSAPTITNCVITDNTAAYAGGILCERESDPLIANCVISRNEVAVRGGGIDCFNSSPTIINCTIAGNTAHYQGGGGVCCWQSRPTITNCAITGNHTDLHGGALRCYESNPTITNCTFTGNTAAGEGGGVRCWDSSPIITNCIWWGDTPDEIHVASGDPPVVSYSDVQGGWAGEGNIDADPVFVDPDGPDDDPDTWEDNDYHLSDGSPCIDAGDPHFVPGPDERDIDGQLRLWDGNDDGEWIVDIGSDEFGSIFPGDLNADGCVDQADLGILLADWDCSGGDCPGDCDFDGDTDQADLGILLAHWGAGCP